MFDIKYKQFSKTFYKFLFEFIEKYFNSMILLKNFISMILLKTAPHHCHHTFEIFTKIKFKDIEQTRFTNMVKLDNFCWFKHENLSVNKSFNVQQLSIFGF